MDWNDRALRQIERVRQTSRTNVKYPINFTHCHPTKYSITYLIMGFFDFLVLLFIKGTDFAFSADITTGSTK
ncbi:hypothetical protein UZ36_02635 [Candidatus Nitromaritima sp. SCGC AAA799-C22]|nr:hypothetical protein UZ36_02635 [Candidatus Nitromaritima sp. SCGC AAA799-C22]